MSRYLKAASNTMVVGHLVGKLIESIIPNLNQNVKTFCIGHSLGAHVCGFAGKTKQFNGIIGLDPAGPVFEYNSPDNRLNKNDGKSVYALHTNTAMFGILKPVGTLDF